MPSCKFLIMDLPTELLQHLFILACNPQLRLVNRAFHALSQNTVVRARYLCQQSDHDVSRAVQSGLLQPQVLRILLQWSRGKGSAMDVHGQDHFFMRWCCAFNKADLLQVLLEQSPVVPRVVPEMNATSPETTNTMTAAIHADNDYALRIASQNGHIAIIRQLLIHGANVHVDTDHPLRSAVQQGHLAVTRLLLAHGADIHADNDFCLRTSASDGHANIVEVLVRGGASVRAQEDEALILACVHGRVEVVRMLLGAGCDARSRNGMAMRGALKGQHWSVVRVLVEEASVPMNTEVVDALVAGEAWDVLEALLRQQQALNKEPLTTEQLPVHFRAVCMSARPSLVEWFLEQGVNPVAESHLLSSMAMSPKGQTAEMLEVARILSRRGVTLNAMESKCLKQARHPIVAAIAMTRSSSLPSLRSGSSSASLRSSSSSGSLPSNFSMERKAVPAAPANEKKGPSIVVKAAAKKSNKAQVAKDVTMAPLHAGLVIRNVAVACRR
jgi:ankyrin repeat protein